MKQFLLLATCLLGTLATAQSKSFTPLVGAENDVAKPGQFPFEVTVIGHTKSNLGIFCSGAILNERWILTSSVCADPATLNVVVQVATISLKKVNPHQLNLTITERIQSPNVQKKQEDVIGLIKLATPLIFNEYVKPISLPRGSIKTNEVAKSLGFHKIALSDGADDLYLQSLNVTKAPVDRCSHFYGVIPTYLLDTLICVENVDQKIGTVCYNEFGNLLVRNSGSKPELLGIGSLSTTLFCNELSNRATRAYIDVAKFVDFIRQKTGISPYCAIEVYGLSSGQLKMSLFEPVTDEQKNRILAPFNRNLDNINEDIQAIKIWFEKQPHLPEIPSDGMIRVFLVLNKLRIERTKKKLDMYYTIRKKIPELFSKINPTVPPMSEFCRKHYFIPLPKLTSDLVRVTIFKMADSDPDQFDPYLFFGWTLNVIELRLKYDYCGNDIAINDLENASFGHVAKINPLAMKKATYVIEKVFTTRTQGIHFINCPPVVDAFLRMFKAMVPPKVAERVFVHDSPESLFKEVPREIMPSDYGGQEKSLKELNEILIQNMMANKERFDKLDKMEVNENLRVEPLDDELLGFQGNFKKLDVD